MREIKFRAWQKTYNYMTLPESIYFSFGKFYHGDPEDGVVYDDSFVVMQFTGLKDKNGKEIYEGDIVLDFMNNPAVVMFGEYSAGGLDYYASAAYGFYVQRYSNGRLQVGDTDTLYDHEVIGNIWEHPNLLESK